MVLVSSKINKLNVYGIDFDFDVDRPFDINNNNLLNKINTKDLFLQKIHLKIVLIYLLLFSELIVIINQKYMGLFLKENQLKCIQF